MSHAPAARATRRDADAADAGRAPDRRECRSRPATSGDLAVILISRNLEYLSQVQSDGQLLAQAGSAADSRSPVRGRCARGQEPAQRHRDSPRAAQGTASAASSGAPPSAMDHVAIIAAQMRRLDEVVQGFLRFIRPEDLKLERVQPSALIDAIRPIVSAEAERHGIELRIEITNGLPDVRVDSGMMQQALLNLALNACQAMPRGGRLSLGASLRERQAGRDRLRGHGPRDQARAPRQDLRPLLHDQGKRQRHRPVDGVPRRPAARRRD